MNKRNTTIFIAVALGISISLLGACGGSDTATTDAYSDTAVPASDESLADVCPATIVIQTDWFPESEHGGLY